MSTLWAAPIILIAFSIIAMRSASCQDVRRVFNVENYGAKANGQTDDQIAIARTIKAAETWTNASDANRAIVYFPAGSYALTSIFGLYAINIINARNLTILGEDCRDRSGNYCVKLIGAPVSFNKQSRLPKYNTFFHVERSLNVTISNFYLDKARPYFSQGKIEKVNSEHHYLEIHVDAGYPDLSDAWVSNLDNIIVVFTEPTLWSWDHSDAACGKTALSNGCSNFHITGQQQIGSHVWRVSLDRPPPPEFLNKPYLMWRNLGWQSGFMIDNSSNITTSNIFYTGGGGPGLHIQRSEGNNVVRNFVVDVPPNSNRLFAATSGFSGSANRGNITLDRVHVEHTDDDAFHFLNGYYYPALKQSPDRRSVDIDLCYDGDFRPGDKVDIWNWTKKESIDKATVISSQVIVDKDYSLFPRVCRLYLDKAIPLLSYMRTYDNRRLGQANDKNDRVLNLSPKTALVVENSYLSSMRARCGIIQVSALIIHSTCENTTLAGFLVGPEFAWGEGYSVNNVSFISNIFFNVSGTAILIADQVQSLASPTFEAMIKDDPDSHSEKDNKNILIQGNTFAHLGTRGRGIMGIRGTAITVANAANVRILGNHIETLDPSDRDAPSDIVVSPRSTSKVIVGP